MTHWAILLEKQLIIPVRAGNRVKRPKEVLCVSKSCVFLPMTRFSQHQEVSEVTIFYSNCEELYNYCPVLLKFGIRKAPGLRPQAGSVDIYWPRLQNMTRITDFLWGVPLRSQGAHLLSRVWYGDKRTEHSSVSSLSSLQRDLVNVRLDHGQGSFTCPYIPGAAWDALGYPRHPEKWHV